MKINIITLGAFQTNCYLLQDEVTGKAVIIDPGLWTRELEKQIAAVGPVNIEYILLTHCHFDHILGVSKTREITRAKVAIHALDVPGLSNTSISRQLFHGGGAEKPVDPDILLQDGDTLSVGTLSIQVMHTPGHTCGSCCYIVDDVIFSGDTLFMGTVGRVDFATGSLRDMLQSVKRLAALPGDYRVLPGHDASTTLEGERRTNPYILDMYPEKEAFLEGLIQ